MKKLIDFIEKKIRQAGREKIIVFGLLLLITFLGAWLRLYHFSGWLHFELDQARDVMLVSHGVQNNFFDLPLLGPRASGTNLQLGPAYYYLEYLSALIFGDTPVGHALFVPLLSIFSIPLMYFLLKRFFNGAISLGLTYLYAISAFFVLYARFSWNPNVSPFFVLLMLYGFFRATDKAETYPGVWLTLAGICLSVATQLHFVAFFSLPIFLVAVVFFKRTSFSWKMWTVFFVAILLVYFPVSINEWKTGGGNTKALIRAITLKKDTKDNPAEQLIASVLGQAKSYTMILTGDDHIFLPKYRFDGFSLKKKCGDHCKQTPTYLALSVIIFFLLGSGMLAYRSFKLRGDFLVMGSLFLSIFLIFILLASDLAPRFYLLVAPFPFIFIGVMVHFIWQRKKLLAQLIFAVIIIFLSIKNLDVLKTRFSQARLATTENVRTKADHIVEEPIRVTLEQQEKIAQYFYEQYQQNGYPVFVQSEGYWERSIKYLTEKRGAPVASFFDTVYLHGNSFIIDRTKKGVGKKLAKYAPFASLKEKKQFGTLSVYALSPNPETASTVDPKIFPLFNVIFGTTDKQSDE